jgi:hypothetical protein
MSVDVARRAYEMGRLRTSFVRAIAISAPLALVALFVVGPSALAWLPLTLSVWIIAHWRGESVLRGALYGLVGGLVTLALPMSILRPCCAGMTSMSGECCTMPGACVASGAAIGLVLAAFVPTDKSSWWKSALGVSLGIASVAMLRCSALYLGEAAGLVGGLLVGVGVTTSFKMLRARHV